MLCRDVTLGKIPGVCSLGIGKILRRLLAKFVLEVAGQQATSTCGTDSLCAGLKLDCKGAIHGMFAELDELSQGEDVGDLFVDGFNGLNKKSCINMLWKICHW